MYPHDILHLTAVNYNGPASTILAKAFVDPQHHNAHNELGRSSLPTILRMAQNIEFLTGNNDRKKAIETCLNYAAQNGLSLETHSGPVSVGSLPKSYLTKLTNSIVTVDEFYQAQLRRALGMP
jgi:hypothetical protein